MLISAGVALPTSKSLKSCAGVIFTAPVPFSGIEDSSAMIGIARPTSGRSRVLPTRSLVALVVGMHGDGGVAEHGLGPRGGDDDEPCRRLDLQRIAEVPEWPFTSICYDLEVGDRGLATSGPS